MIMKHWTKREEQIERVMGATVGMRAALLCLVLVMSNACIAASHPPVPSISNCAASEPCATQKSEVSAASVTDFGAPSTANIHFAQSGVSNQTEAKKPHKPSEEWWATPDWWIAIITAILAVVTWSLVVQTRRLVAEAQSTSNRQAHETAQAIAISRQTADAARDSADALICTSMPVLSPTVINMGGLHPLIPIQAAHKHDANIFVRFENFGSTTGIIRDVRAKLYLTLNDVLPEPNPSEWVRYPYNVMIPGKSSAADQTFGALDMKQNIEFGKFEGSELHAEADFNGKFRRFVLMGMVAYDDLFGWRHSRTYCVKMRVWLGEDGKPNQFQVGVGSPIYNKWTKEKVPSHDPLEA